MFSLIAIISNAYAAGEKVTEKVVEKTLATEPAAQIVNEAASSSLWSNLLNSDPIVKMTLLLLIFFSVACWAIIFLKSQQLRGAQKTSQNFWHKFSSTSKISDLPEVKRGKSGPLYEIFATGNNTLNKMKQNNVRLTDYSRNVLAQRMNQSREEEVYKLEQYVNFLATTASVAPFIGLFGTVWGILTAFMAIGKAGSSSLATVGPYISEALVATAVGLFAAIPAVIAYNYFVNKIRIINKMIDLFMDDFILKSERELQS